jgi:hypothetical protein
VKEVAVARGSFARSHHSLDISRTFVRYNTITTVESWSTLLHSAHLTPQPSQSLRKGRFFSSGIWQWYASE